MHRNALATLFFRRWTEMGPRKFLGEPRPPHRGVSGGGGAVLLLTCLWLKGLRHPSFRNGFNWQRPETVRIATLSQHIAF